MSENLRHGSALNELMRECFRLNRSLLEASQQLTSGSSVTAAQWGVLAALGRRHAPTTVAETARQMGLARQSVQRVADILASQKLVRYLPNPADKRVKLIRVTATGNKLLEQMEARQYAWVDGLTGDYSDAEISAAMQLVKNIRQRVNAQAERE